MNTFTSPTRTLVRALGQAGLAVVLVLLGLQAVTPDHPQVDPVEISATSWTPDLLGTGGKPSLGTGSVEVGQYVHDSDDWCRGFGLIRWGTGGNDGTGVWRVTLPEPADPSYYNVDPSNSEMIGTVTFGAGLYHWTGGLHLTGLTGYVSTSNAVVAIEGGLFLGADYPAVADSALGNVHYHFDYACSPA